MAIDRIGKGGVPPVASEAPAPDKAGGAGAAGSAFHVDHTERAEAATAVAPANAASPLARLQAGEIDVNRYVDLKVDEATANLQGLSSAELDDIKKILRDQIATDPGLSDLVRSATGNVPTPPED